MITGRRGYVAALVAALVMLFGSMAAAAAYATSTDSWPWSQRAQSGVPWQGGLGMMDRDQGDDYGSGGMMSGESWRGSMGRWMAQSRPTSEADYLSEMVAHHEEAVTAAAELARSKRAQMRNLGASIVQSQTAQIEQMNDWLMRWHPDATPATYEPMMRDLSELQGDELDRAFLDDMIGHHMMAVMMSQHFRVSGIGEHDEVTALAEQIRDEQHGEIATMMRWYRDWYGSSWRGGPMGMMGSMGMTSGRPGNGS